MSTHQPSPRLLGSDRDGFGRTAPHPAAPRRHDPEAPKAKRTVPHLDLPQAQRAAVERGVLTGHLTASKPRWVEGDRVTLTRRVRERSNAHGRKETDRDKPLAVVVSSITEHVAGDLQADDVRPLGFRTITDFARDYLGVGEHMNALMLQARLKRDRSTVWLTRWRVELPHDVRLLPSGGGGGEDYVGSRARSMEGGQPAPLDDRLRFRTEDAGEAVDEEYQARLTELAQAMIADSVARKARESSALQVAARAVRSERRARLYGSQRHADAA